jgi:putative oxidoreductase
MMMNIFTLVSANEKTSAAVSLLARVFLAAIFLLAALNKIQYFDGNAQYLASAGLPESLLPLVIAFELIGGLFILAGFLAELTALAFAVFSVVTALLYHNNLGDQMQFLMFFKNIAIAGGFLMLAAKGAGKYSVDNKISK